MKYSALAFLAAAGLAAAQDPSTCTDLIFAFPACGFAVISSTASVLGCTDFNDAACLCSSSDAITSALSTGTDFSSTCSEQGDPSSSSELTDAYNTLCSCVSNTALPTTSSTTDVTTTTDTTSSSAISTGTTGTGSTGTGSTGITTPTGTAPTVSIPTSSLSGVSPTISGAPTVTGAPTGSKISSKSVISLTKFTGAAATAGTFLPVGGVLGAVLGLLAYL